ncbi:hypothetical protein COLO4_19622 [Corchorus olitorius]|uniref:Uncharacterized protein n=1 Tax=Corchorus olitorius TaxID=93759 RepID=A0A1R3J4H2_9ROSI|nr:hypothetical protein COLO4_19622 [Corchorus olitorius]
MTLNQGQKCQLIQFGSLEPVLVQFSEEKSVGGLVAKGGHDNGNEVWTFVKQQNSRRRRHQPKISTVGGRYQGKYPLSPTKKGYEEHSLKVSNNETSRQSLRKPVMLKEFLPQEFFNEDQGMVNVHVVSFEELSEDEKPRVLSSSKDLTTKALLEHEWKDDKKTCGRIPSRMKRHLLLEIDTNGPLNVKHRVVVCTTSSVQGKLSEAF